MEKQIYTAEMYGSYLCSEEALLQAFHTHRAKLGLQPSFPCGLSPSPGVWGTGRKCLSVALLPSLSVLHAQMTHTHSSRDTQTRLSLCSLDAIYPEAQPVFYSLRLKSNISGIHLGTGSHSYNIPFN